MGGAEAAQAWPWERMARSNAPSHDLLAEVLDPRPGERWIDLGTGSGGVALRLAARGADVVGVDTAADAIDRARAAAATERVAARFELADAAALPYPDGAFDGVASAFGVMFGRHASVAGEIARVCMPGGRLGLALMPPGSRAAELWTLLRRFGVGGEEHPADFAERVDELLGDSFELETRTVETEAHDHGSPEDSWAELSRSFGPLRELLAELDEERAGELRQEFLSIDERFRDGERSYVVALGRRR